MPVIDEDNWVNNLKPYSENMDNYLYVISLLRNIMSDFLLQVDAHLFDQQYFLHIYNGQVNKVTLRRAVEFYTDHIDDHIGYIKKNLMEFNRMS